jgi:hypothetical protein
MDQSTQEQSTESCRTSANDTSTWIHHTPSLAQTHQRTYAQLTSAYPAVWGVRAAGSGLFKSPTAAA